MLQFDTDLIATLEKARGLYGLARLLIDARENPVQSREVSESFNSPETYIKEARERVATVVASSLVKMQVNRMTLNPQCRTFDTIDEAEAWFTAE